MIRILDSAYKHDICESDITIAWQRPIASFTEREDPLKVIRLGFDSHARIIEVGGENIQKWTRKDISCHARSTHLC